MRKKFSMTKLVPSDVTIRIYEEKFPVFPDKTIPRQFIAEVKLSKKSKKYYGNGEFVITARYEHELLHKLGNYLLAETEWLHHSDQEE